MARYLRAIPLVATLGLSFTLISPILAQTTDPQANPAATPAPKHYRTVSPELAASLAATMPKYNPPKPVEKKPDDDVDLRDVDKPKNQIIRLPKYVVQEQKPPVFRERELYTAKGLAALAIRRYLSSTDLALNSTTLPLFGLSNEARALAMYAEDERLKNMADLKDSARTVGIADPTEADYIRKVTQDTYLRSSDFGTSSIGPK